MQLWTGLSYKWTCVSEKVCVNVHMWLPVKKAEGDHLHYWTSRGP